jgi:hypothetical protein
MKMFCARLADSDHLKTSDTRKRYLKKASFIVSVIGHPWP